MNKEENKEIIDGIIDDGYSVNQINDGIPNNNSEVIGFDIPSNSVEIIDNNTSNGNDFVYDFSFADQIQPEVETNSSNINNVTNVEQEVISGSNDNVHNNEQENNSAIISQNDNSDEVIGLDESLDIIDTPEVQVMDEGINDSNSINPNLIVNPIIENLNNNAEIIDVSIDEPKVDYDKIKHQKNMMFLGVFFGLIILFIILLPRIVELIS